MALFSCLGSSLPLTQPPFGVLRHLRKLVQVQGTKHFCKCKTKNIFLHEFEFTWSSNVPAIYIIYIRYTSSPGTGDQAISQIDCIFIHFQNENNPEKCNQKQDAKCFTVFQTMSGFKYRSEKSTTPMAHTSLAGMYIFHGSKVMTSGAK